MMRKFLQLIAEFVFRPYFERSRAAAQKFQEAMQVYNSGDKVKALEQFKQIVKEDPSCKASRGKIGQIWGELEEERKANDLVNKR